MRPHNDIHLSSVDRIAIAIRSRGTIGACVLVAFAALALAMSGRDADHIDLAAHAEAQPPLAQTCQQWHEAASNAVARLVQSTRDVDLRQVGDAVFRLRRARRNCEAGWFTTACQDYRALAHSSGGRAAAFDGVALACATFEDEPVRAVSRQSPRSAR